MKVHFLVVIRRRAVDTPCAFLCLPLWEKRDGFDEDDIVRDSGQRQVPTIQKHSVDC